MSRTMLHFAPTQEVLARPVIGRRTDSPKQEQAPAGSVIALTQELNPDGSCTRGLYAITPELVILALVYVPTSQVDAEMARLTA